MSSQTASGQQRGIVQASPAPVIDRRTIAIEVVAEANQGGADALPVGRTAQKPQPRIHCVQADVVLQATRSRLRAGPCCRSAAQRRPTPCAWPPSVARRAGVALTTPATSVGADLQRSPARGWSRGRVDTASRRRFENAAAVQVPVVGGWRQSLWRQVYRHHGDTIAVRRDRYRRSGRRPPTRHDSSP